MKHLGDNEIAQALKILEGPPELAGKQQIETELPHLFQRDDNCPPIPAANATPINATDAEAIAIHIERTLTHSPKHRGGARRVSATSTSAW